jgi:hypothetical protein
MTNRREILRAAAVSPALPLVTGTTSAVGAALTTRIALYAVLIDERYSVSRTVGARLSGRGATVHAIPEGDVTQIWLQNIGPAWRREPVAVAGLTARPALFCLEQLALSSGLRVVFHAEHVVHPEAPTEHSILRGAEAADLSARDLRRAGPLWPARLADAIATHRESLLQRRVGPSDAALDPALPTGAYLLTSWIIAAA